MTALSFMQGTRFRQSSETGHKSSRTTRAWRRDLPFVTEIFAEIPSTGTGFCWKSGLARNACTECKRFGNQTKATSVPGIVAKVHDEAGRRRPAPECVAAARRAVDQESIASLPAEAGPARSSLVVIHGSRCQVELLTRSIERFQRSRRLPGLRARPSMVKQRSAGVCRPMAASFSLGKTVVLRMWPCSMRSQKREQSGRGGFLSGQLC